MSKPKPIVAPVRRRVLAEKLEPRQLLSAVSGLNATYFDHPDLTGPTVSRVDANINFNWGSGSPDRAINPETFSARWTGKIQPKYAERYTFRLTADDGARLWVNGQLVIDAWAPQGTFTSSGAITFQGGELHDIKLEYRENGGRAYVTLAWESQSQARQTVPTTALYPEVAPDTTVPEPPPPTSVPAFKVYDATLLRNKPTKTLAGMDGVVVLYGWGFGDSGLWPTNETPGIPSVARFARLLNGVRSGTPVVLDIERWFHDTDDENVWRQTYADLTQVVRNFKQARPDLPVACFDALPFGVNYVVHNVEADRSRFEMQTRLLNAPGGLNKVVDFHTAGAGAVWDKRLSMDDWEQWIRWRTEQLRVLNKPIYWMIHPYYSGTKQLVTDANWDRQISVTREIADSVIVWTDLVPSFTSTDHWYQTLLQ